MTQKKLVELVIYLMNIGRERNREKEHVLKAILRIKDYYFIFS